MAAGRFKNCTKIASISNRDLTKEDNKFPILYRKGSP